MDKPKTKPAPKPSHTWTAADLAKLQAAALAVGGAPEKEPTEEEGKAFAEEVPYLFPHIAAATYSHEHKRVGVSLHGGSRAFPVPCVGEPAPKAAEPAKGAQGPTARV